LTAPKNRSKTINQASNMRTILLLCCLIFLPLGGFAQGTTAVERPVSEQQWKKAASDLDYSKDVSKQEKPKKKQAPQADGPNPLRNFNTALWGNVLQILVLLLAVVAIGYGIYRMLQEPRNRRIARDGAEITEENLEAYLHETDLDRFLREALARGDYPQAVRVYFLQVIKHLSESGAILWSKEKTNRDYLREMRAHPQFTDFQRATGTFERVWYGNAPLDAAGFDRVEPEFKVLL
jgi:hypothetical protein